MYLELKENYVYSLLSMVQEKNIDRQIDNR